MALKLAKVAGEKKKVAAPPNTDLGIPTTQVKMGTKASTRHDPLSTVSIMDQLKTATPSAATSKGLPLIGHLPVVKQFQILGLLLLTFLALAVLMLFLDGRTASQQTASFATAVDMQMLSQRVTRSSVLATQGQSGAVQAVRESRDRFQEDLNAFLNGGSMRGVSLDVAQEPSVVETLQAIKVRWERVNAAVERIVGSETTLVAVAKGNEAVGESSRGLAELAQQAGQQLLQAGGSPRDVELTTQLAGLTQRIAKNVGTLTSADDVDPDIAAALNKDTAAFRDTLAALSRSADALRQSSGRGDEARATLAEISKRATKLDAGVSAIAANAQRLGVAKQSVRTINADGEPLYADTTKLVGDFEGSGKTHIVTFWAAIIFGALALACLVLLGFIAREDARGRAHDSEGENKRNQEAILRLLNEMGNLADGDLTVQASVTEDVTGAIADSINFTIEELRTLVKGINSATDQVTKATQETQAISNRLFEASQRQNKEIQHASASVLTMAQSISEVAQNAAQSAKVAQVQLSAAEKGGSAVQNQIAGMNEIRTQIQETSKRIKRLGESSLEIGEIVELISDITEQTNVLALNAAIQAASAGEAGRGFTVVAEEVQRLAERSGEATKQIEAIVKTIQSDTQDAVAAMDRSTVGVVEGAKLSDAAGQALAEIQSVSRELAELIGRISAQTQTQSASVADVTRGMQGILKITEETTEGTKQTNVSIGQLTKLAAELRSSVAGFKV
ncbi:MAG: methyl-accepting chemotaxis protein [Betaproteobacteria bacterium]|nr:MAG: methyl-accepting chemotaxis protein [Betaproteobacteria bacterium]TMH64624.1 MAG: methyl-accepting chemotaxis protein [Betaproteobacteria bacterium]